jgi:hypothetical protein
MPCFRKIRIQTNASRRFSFAEANVAISDNPYAADAANGQAEIQAKRASPILVWGCAAAVVGLLLATTAAVAFLIGGITGQIELYETRAAMDAQKVRAFLSEHPGRFEGVEIQATSDGLTYLTGEVETPADLDTLTRGMQRLFGEERGEGMVSVEAKPANAANPKNRKPN